MKKSLLLFATVTILVLFAAWFSVQLRSPETVVKKEPLYPELGSRIKDISLIEIKSQDHTTVLAAKGDQWVLKNRGGYPAIFNRIKPLVLAISELEIREAKTSNSEWYSRLQVEDVTAEKAKSRQITLLDAKGDIIASLLVGKERVNRSDGRIDSLYVRKAGDQQSYLVKGDISVSADPADWLDNNLIDLTSDRLQSILIDHGDAKTVMASRTDKDDINYQLENIPSGFKLKSQTTVNGLATAVEALRFDDVQSSENFTWPEQTLKTVYKTFDGLVANVRSTKIEDKIWAALSFDFAGPEAVSSSQSGMPESEAKQPTVQEQVDQLNAKTAAWVYALPAYKGEMLTRTINDLIIEEGQEAEEEKTPEAAPGMMMPPGAGMQEMGMPPLPPME